MRAIASVNSTILERINYCVVIVATAACEFTVMRPLLVLALSFFVLLLNTPRCHADSTPNATLECNLCIGTLSLLANYSLEDPKIVDWLMAHILDAALAAGVCSKDGGPSGVLTPDVCRGAIGEYTPIIASIVATGPPLTNHTVRFICEVFKFCEIAKRQNEGLRPSARPRIRKFPSPRDQRSDLGVREVGTFVVMTDIHWDPDYASGTALCSLRL
jgi:hypothetical protein